MCSAILPALVAFFLAQGAGWPEERFSAVRRLSAQQYKEDYHLLAPEHGPSLALSWRSTARPPFSWEFLLPDASQPGPTLNTAIPVKASSYFADRHRPEHLASFLQENNEVGSHHLQRHKSNNSAAQGANIIPRKSKSKKIKKWRTKNKLSVNCTEKAGSLSHNKPCQSERKQIKKVRAQRRKKKRRMKELRKERLRRKDRQKKKFEKLAKERSTENIHEKFFRFEHEMKSSEHGFTLTSTSNGTVGVLERSSATEPLKSDPDLGGTNPRSYEIANDVVAGVVPGLPRDANIPARDENLQKNSSHTGADSITSRPSMVAGNSVLGGVPTMLPSEAASTTSRPSIVTGDAVAVGITTLPPGTDASIRNQDQQKNYSRTEAGGTTSIPSAVASDAMTVEVPMLPTVIEASTRNQDQQMNKSCTEAVATSSTEVPWSDISDAQPSTGRPSATSSHQTTFSPLQRPDHSDSLSLNMVDETGPLLGSEKGDLSCVFGRFLPAPAVKHADVKYIRTGELADGILIARYECQLGYRLQQAAHYRLWCWHRTWQGEVPHCVPSGEEPDELDTSAHCSQCEQLCLPQPSQPPLCACYRGFQQQGNTCHDINECSVENGGCQHECVNTVGAFFCRCPPGFRLELNGKTCRDINECLLRNGHGPCQDTCTNLHGGYTCSCDGIPGTRLSADNHTCEDVDECAAGTAGCSHTCLNTLGKVFCLCPAGFELGPDWKTCQDIDECQDALLQEEVCATECLNTVGSYHCRTPGDQPAAELNRTGEAECPAGLQWIRGSCEDVDECAVDNGGCAHRCVNTRGSFLCRCKLGFALDLDQLSCIEAAAATVCPPLDVPPQGYLQCERQVITVRRPRYSARRRVVNHAGTVCHLRCPLGWALRGQYRRSCSTSGTWTGPEDGVCLQIHYVDANEVLPSVLLKRSLRGWDVYQYPRHYANYIRVTFGFIAPTMTCPEDVTAQLLPGRRTTHVVFEQPATSVDWFRHVVSEPMWGKRLEGDLPAGVWMITFTARHPVSQLAASCTLTITVTAASPRSE